MPMVNPAHVTTNDHADGKFSKGDLNQFRHKMVSAPDHVAKKWETLFKLPRANMERKEFVREVLRIAQARVDFIGSYFDSFREIVNDKTTGKHGGMITWEQLKELHGEKNALAMATHKRLPMQINPEAAGLPGVVWPEDQLFARTKDKWSDTTSVREGVRESSNFDSTEETHNASGALFHSMGEDDPVANQFSVALQAYSRRLGRRQTRTTRQTVSDKKWLLTRSQPCKQITASGTARGVIGEHNSQKRV